MRYNFDLALNVAQANYNRRRGVVLAAVSRDDVSSGFLRDERSIRINSRSAARDRPADSRFLARFGRSREVHDVSRASFGRCGLDRELAHRIMNDLYRHFA